MPAQWMEIGQDWDWDPSILRQLRATLEGHTNGEAVPLEVVTVEDPDKYAARWKNKGGGGAGQWQASDDSEIAAAPDSGFRFAKPVTGTGASFSGAVSVQSLASNSTVSAVGAITGASLTVTTSVTAATGSFSGAITGASVTVVGQVKGATGLFSGQVRAGSLLSDTTIAGASVAATGDIAGATGTFTGALTALSLTTTGGVTAGAASSFTGGAAFPTGLTTNLITAALAATRLVEIDVATDILIGNGVQNNGVRVNASGVIALNVGGAQKIRATTVGCGFQGGAAVGIQTIGGTATDLPTVIALANNIRTALRNYTLCN